MADRASVVAIPLRKPAEAAAAILCDDAARALNDTAVQVETAASTGHGVAGRSIVRRAAIILHREAVVQRHHHSVDVEVRRVIDHPPSPVIGHAVQCIVGDDDVLASDQADHVLAQIRLGRGGVSQVVEQHDRVAGVERHLRASGAADTNGALHIDHALRAGIDRAMEGKEVRSVGPAGQPRIDGARPRPPLAARTVRRERRELLATNVGGDTGDGALDRSEVRITTEVAARASALHDDVRRRRGMRVDLGCRRGRVGAGEIRVVQRRQLRPEPGSVMNADRIEFHRTTGRPMKVATIVVALVAPQPARPAGVGVVHANESFVGAGRCSVAIQVNGDELDARSHRVGATARSGVERQVAGRGISRKVREPRRARQRDRLLLLQRLAELEDAVAQAVDHARGTDLVPERRSTTADVHVVVGPYRSAQLVVVIEIDRASRKRFLIGPVGKLREAFLGQLDPSYEA